MDRRTLMTGMLGTAAAALWTPPDAFALGLPKDKIKRIRYYKTPTDAAGRPNIHQPTFNQSTNVVTIETESGLIGIGEGGEPSTMEQCAGLLIGQDPFRIEHLWQRMFRGYFYPAGREKTHSLGGLDLALWDLKGKLLGHPVYELMGGPATDRIRCYATGHDHAWFTELGFQAMKLVLPFAEAGGIAALDAAEKLVAETREAIGWERELMLDCWPVSEVEFMVRVAERLRPYRLKWLEDFLTPEDYAGFDAMRTRVPWQTLATGERWYTPLPFLAAAKSRCVDIFQPDVQWVGGVTGTQKVAAIADAAGIGLAMHGGVNDAYGQHVCYALPGNQWGEIYVASAPGVPLEEGWRPTPGMAVPRDGWLVPSDAPGFGIEMTQDELEAAVD